MDSVKGKLRAACLLLLAVLVVAVMLPVFAPMSIAQQSNNPDAQSLKGRPLYGSIGNGQTWCYNTTTKRYTACNISSGGGITAMTTGAVDPSGSCAAPGPSVLNLYTNTATADIWACVATNTWRKILTTTNTGVYVATGTTGTAPSTPVTGDVSCYYDSTTKTQICIDDAGNASTTVRGLTAVASQWVRYVGADGVQYRSQPSFTDIAGTWSNAQIPTVLDFSAATSTVPAKVTATPPAACAVGQMFFDSDAPAGQNWLGCTATNTWTVMGGSSTPKAAVQILNSTPVCNDTLTTMTGGTLTLPALGVGGRAHVDISLGKTTTDGMIFQVKQTNMAGTSVAYGSIGGADAYVSFTLQITQVTSTAIVVISESHLPNQADLNYQFDLTQSSGSGLVLAIGQSGCTTAGQNAWIKAATAVVTGAP